MSNPFYTAPNFPLDFTRAKSAPIRSQYAGIEAGFDQINARINLFSAGGTANALTATLTAAIGGYQDGFSLKLAIAADNTGAATLNVNTLGPVPIVSPNGAALVAGVLLAGTIETLTYLGGKFVIGSSASGYAASNSAAASASAAAGSATAAAGSATAAASSATGAAASASTASAQAGVATTQAGLAATARIAAEYASTHGLKGDPGGNISAIGPFVGLAGITVPAGTALVQSSGFTTAGDQGRATYTTATTGNPYVEKFTALDGRVFEIEINGEIHCRAWGASESNTPTQNTTAIQKAVDAALWMCANGKGTHAVIIDGAYQTNKSIKCFNHNGTAYTSVAQIAIIGRGRMGLLGTGSQPEIIATNKNVPAFIVQWARSPLFKDFTITGQATAYPGYEATYAQLLNDETSPWWNTGGARDTRWSPYAGICMDPFATTLPADGGYPGMNGAAGAPNYYTDFNATTGLLIDQMVIRGFIVAVMLSPHQTLQLGDSVVIKDCFLSENKVPVAIGQSQDRGISIIRPHAISFRIFVDCMSYGQGSGPSPMVTGGVLALGKWLLAANYQGSGSWTGMYAESLFSLGFWSSNLPLTFQDCGFNLVAPDPAYPGSAECHLVALGQVRFRGGYLRYYINGEPMQLAIWNANSISFDGTKLNSPPIFRDPYNVTFNDCLTDNGKISTRFRTEIAANSLGSSTWHGEELVEGYSPLTRFKFTNLAHIETLGMGVETITINTTTRVGTFTTANPSFFRPGETIVSYSPARYMTGWRANVDNMAEPDMLFMPIGQVLSVVGSVVTLQNMVRSLTTGSYVLQVQHRPRLRLRTLGTTAAGSPIITAVSPVGNWAVGDRIKGTNVPDRCYITAISGTTITVSANCVGAGTTVLYDAELVARGQANIPPTTGVWKKGDFIDVYNGGAVDASNMLKLGWQCTVEGSPGTWVPVYGSIVSPAV